jgi:uncharacterized protein (DUF1778 family)
MVFNGKKMSIKRGYLLDILDLMPRPKRKTTAVHFRVTKEEAEILERAAAADDRTLTDFCRVAARSRARQILDMKEVPPVRPETKKPK